MHGSTKFLIATAVVVLATGLLTLAWLSGSSAPDSEPSPPDMDASSAAEVAEDPHLNDNSASDARKISGPIADPATVTAQFFRAPAARDAADALDAVVMTADNEAEVMALRELLAQVCSESRPRVAESQRAAWYLEQIDDYCGTFSISREDHEEIADWNMVHAVAQAEELADRMQGMTLAQQSAFLLDAIGSAASFLDLEAIKLALSSSFFDARATDREYPWQIHDLGQDPSLFYRDPQGPEIQSAALTLLQCQEFVDCGPNSPFTWYWCFSRAVCEPGWDLYAYLNHVHSPLEDEQILAILELLLELRGG